MDTRAFPDFAGRTILQVIPDLAAGGAERTVIEIAEALSAANARALVVSRGGRLEPALATAGGQLVKMNVATKNPIGMRGNATRLTALIRTRHVDLIHARSRAPAWSSLWAARRTGIPYVTTYHGAYSASAIPKRYYNSVMARGDRVIANSNWIADHVRSDHGVPDDRLVTIARGVDTAQFDPAGISDDTIAAQRAVWGLSPDDNRRVVLLPARLTPWKGQAAAIEAFSRLDDPVRRSALLVLMGDAQGRDGYVDDLRAAVDAGRLGGDVVFAEHSTDMPPAFAAADIVLTPSVRPEAFGRTAAEASAMAKPVIAFAHGGALETIVDGVTGRLVPFDPFEIRRKDPHEGLASALAELLLAPADRLSALGAAGRAHIVGQFTKRGLQTATLRVYADLLKIGH